MIVVFSDEWLERGNDYINPFLANTFAGKTRDQYENARSSDGLIDTIKKLESNQKDFFLVFAHVEEKGGLWHELDGGRLQELGKRSFLKEGHWVFKRSELVMPLIVPVVKK